MYPDLFGNIFDHHRLQFIDAAVEEFALPLHDGLADFQNRLFALFDVFHQH